MTLRDDVSKPNLFVCNRGMTNLQPVNIYYENSSNSNQSVYARRPLKRSNAKRNVTKKNNSRAVRRFSLGNKGNVKAINKNTLRLQAFAQALANAPENKQNIMLAHMNRVLKTRKRN
jgi:hypothetical protein